MLLYYYVLYVYKECTLNVITWSFYKTAFTKALNTDIILKNPVTSGSEVWIFTKGDFDEDSIQDRKIRCRRMRKIQNSWKIEMKMISEDKDRWIS